MRQLLGRSHWAVGASLSTIGLEADHRQTRLWYAEVAEWAPECTKGQGCPEKLGDTGSPGWTLIKVNDCSLMRTFWVRLYLS